MAEADDRGSFQAVAEARLLDAEALLDAGRYEGAYYMAGYAVECALKACIAKMTRAHAFPPRNAQKFYSHRLDELLGHSGLEPVLNQQSRELQDNWATVLQWKEVKRYETWVGAQPQRSATEMLKAIQDRPDGVFPWLKSHW